MKHAARRVWRRTWWWRMGRCLAVVALFGSALAGGLVTLRVYQASPAFDVALGVIFALMLILIGLAVGWFILSTERLRAALREAKLEARRLLRERRALRRADRELQSAKDKAEAANQAKTRYMTGLSHELRTPLNAIYGFAQLLENAQDIPNDRRTAITTIRRSSEHLTGLIEGLLDVSRIESGRLEIQRDQIDLRAFLTQIASIFEASAGRKGIEFGMKTRGKLPRWIACDEKRLRQIIINLLSNAIRYTETGRVDFLFHYRSEVAMIEVRDTGIGIRPEDIETIWLPFQRGRHLEQPGSGLGLTITKLLVEILGGEIELESEFGKGSVFRARLLLPSVPHQGHDTLTGTANPSALQPTGYEGKARTILLVDDDLNHLTLVASFLKPIGFVVHTASSAEQALAMLDHFSPDLFIFDIDMPELDGWGLARRVRGGSPGTTPIIMISAHASDGLAPESENALCDAFLAKPYNLNDLLTKVAGLLDIRLNRRPACESVSETVVSPAGGMPRELVEELTELASIGHARRIEIRLDEIERTHPDTRTLVTQLRKLHATFDMPGMVQFLEGMQTDGS